MESSAESNIEDEFSEAADFVQNAAGNATATKIDDKVLLQLYGLYKAATIGPCNESQPSMFNFKAKAKWSAWKGVSSLTPENAMEQYVELVKGTFDWTPTAATTTKKSASKDSSGGLGMGNAVSSFAQPQEEHDKETDNPVFALCKDNDLAQLEEWIKTVDNVDVKDENGLSPLHWCVDRGYLEACRLLLLHGANPSFQDNEGSSCIDYAETCEHIEIMELLKQYL